MYVPGNDERKMAKIPVLGADCVCLDCEDGVAINKKEAARENIRHLLDTQCIDFGKGGMLLNNEQRLFLLILTVIFHGLKLLNNICYRLKPAEFLTTE